MTRPADRKLSVEDLYPKTLSAVQYMARTLMTISPGEQLPTTQEWMAGIQAGSGTVQTALGILEAAEAVRVAARGAQGSVLLDRQIERLWEFSGLPPLVGALPLPYSLEFQGMATALEREFQGRRLPVRLVYVNGARARFERLTHRHWYFVLASRWAAERSGADDLPIVHQFSPGTYYAQDSVVILKRVVDREAIRTVGIDESSDDHSALSRAEFAGVEWVNVPYGQLPWLIARGTIDAAIWHTTALMPVGIMDHLVVAPFGREPTRHLAQAMNKAVLVARRDAAVTQHILGILRPSVMEETQAAVCRGDGIPYD